MAIAELIARLFAALIVDLAWFAFTLGLTDEPKKRKGERPSGRGTL